MGTIRRKQLKPAKELSDAAFLAGAARSASRARNRLERTRQVELVRAETDRIDRLVTSGKAGQGSAQPMA